MHHGPEMSSVSLLIQPSSITPTLTPGRDDEEEEELGKKNWQPKRGKQMRKAAESSTRTWSRWESVSWRNHTHTKKSPCHPRPSVVFGSCVSVCACVWWGLCCVASGSDEIKHLTALYTQTQHARDQTYFITYKQPDISVVSALTERTHLYPHVHTCAAIKGKGHCGGLDKNSQFYLYSTKSQSQLILKRGTFLKRVSAVTTNLNVTPAAYVHSTI